MTTIDPLAEKDRRWSPYVYGHNNPIRNIDVAGMFVAPGDPFKTPDAAAKDFAKLYNDNSIKDNKEFATTIYKVGVGKDAYYTYTPPAEAKESSSQPKDAGSGLAYEDVATAHTHGAYSGNQAIQYDDNHFSPADKDYAKATDMPNYVATPNGSLQKVDTKGNITTIAKDIPSDASDPTRLNKVDATKLPKNEPTYSAGDWLKFKILLPIGAGAQAIKN